MGPTIIRPLHGIHSVVGEQWFLKPMVTFMDESLDEV
jgi:hypothetical protein